MYIQIVGALLHLHNILKTCALAVAHYRLIEQSFYLCAFQDNYVMPYFFTNLSFLQIKCCIEFILVNLRTTGEYIS